MDRFICVLILLHLLSCTPQVFSNYFDTCETNFGHGLVIRGNGTRRGEFPFLCALYDIEEDEIFCGGTLITTKHVLTGKTLNMFAVDSKIQPYQYSNDSVNVYLPLILIKLSQDILCRRMKII